MRKIFSYISKVLLFIGVVYAEPDSKVEALEGRKQESSLDKKIRQELKSKELKNKDLKIKKKKRKTPKKRKKQKPKESPEQKSIMGILKIPLQRSRLLKSKGVVRAFKIKARKIKAFKITRQNLKKKIQPLKLLKKIRKQALAPNSIPFLVILITLPTTPLKIRS